MGDQRSSSPGAAAGTGLKVALALALGLALLLLVVGLAAVRGLGAASVPPGAVAIVEDAPDGTIGIDEFDRAVQQAARREGDAQVPERGDPRFEQLKDSAMNDLIVSRWVAGEAEHRGISVSAAEVEQELNQFRSESFDSPRAFERFKQRAAVSDADLNDRIRFTLLNGLIEDDVLGPELDGGGREVEIPESRIEAFFEQNRGDFDVPETRDVRLVLNKDRDEVLKAKALLERDDSPASWERVARRHSTDSSTKDGGGLVEAVVEGGGVPEFDAAIFSAPPGEIVGPFETGRGFWVTQVVGTSEAETGSVEEAREEIREQLRAIVQQERESSFQTDFVEKWRSRTFCAEEFAMARCDNYPVPLPPGAPPVISTRPVPPGFAGVADAFRPRGEPQGPLPPASAPVPGENLSPRAQPLVPEGGGDAGSP